MMKMVIQWRHGLICTLIFLNGKSLKMQKGLSTALESKMKIVAISDTHNQYRKLTIPECDILIDCGDYSGEGRPEEIKRFYEWLNEQEAGYIISVQGNHELMYEKTPKKAREIALKSCPSVYLLEHESVIIEGIKIFGSPWTPYFYNWAYNAGRTIAEAAFYQKPFIGDLWKDIPNDTDILITHGPPYEILDELKSIYGDPKGIFTGCVELRDKVKKVKPGLHLFGHIHCGHGEVHIDGTSYYNVAVCDEMYTPSNGITIIDYLTNE